jgi:hypothetical protein
LVKRLLPYIGELRISFDAASEETYKKISLDMSQIEFQREVGRLEVPGELLIKNK